MHELKPPYPLRSIELRHFKSITHTALELRPFSVVVGANSSGKSTLLQALLAVAQTMRVQSDAAEFPLNGEFLRLGTLEETRNFLSTDPSEPMTIKVGIRYHDRQRRFIQGEDIGQAAMLRVEWRLDLTENSLAGSGFARVAGIGFEVAEESSATVDDSTRLLTLDLQEIEGDSDVANVERVRLRFRHAAFFRRGASSFLNRDTPTVAVSGRVMDWRSGESVSVEATTLAGGLPTEVFSRSDKFNALCGIWWEVASVALSEQIAQAKRDHAERIEEGDQPSRGSRAAITQAYEDFQQMRVGETEDSENPLPSYLKDRDFVFRQQFIRLPNRKRKNIAQCMVQLGESTFRQRLRRKFKGAPWLDDEVLVEPSDELLRPLVAASVGLTHSFRSVRYLGPLREAPQVLYDPGPSRLDLGVKGEYSAAVLHAQAERKVLMPTTEGDAEERSLAEALDFWLQEFGIAKAAEAEDRGRLGIGLRVTPLHADRSVDLTSVGVGVSQVLPVILLCLLAPLGTMIIIEQPELHLHPSLQQRLADFLLACVRSGRQILVESHSEHIINRLRRRVAEDPTDDTRELVGLLFAEQREGITRYRPSEINPLGGLNEDWPEGFLDLGSREAQTMVQRSLEKRRRQTQSPSG